MGSAALSPTRITAQPESIGEFRKSFNSSEDCLIPEIPEKRKVTDFKFIVIFAVCLALLVPFLIYTLVYSDIDRYVHGYDTCGNVCGKQNDRVNGIFCSGQDMSNKPFLKYDKVQRYSKDEDHFIPSKCVARCAYDYITIFNRCFPQEKDFGDDSDDFRKFLGDLVEDLQKSVGYIVLMVLIGLGLAFGVLFLFRYFVATVVWVILIGSLLGFIFLTVLFWCVDAIDTRGRHRVRALAIILTVLSVILTLVLICMIKRIKLVIRLFKEAIKVIFGIPSILFEPALTSLAIVIATTIFLYITILIFTAGFLQPVSADLYEYVPNGAMMFTLWYNVIIMIWMGTFIIGCQHMVISGAVAAYYFAGDKSHVPSPIYNSFYNLIRYHLGTVVFGSLIITLVTVIKQIIRGLVNNKSLKVLVDCCLGMVEEFLKYLSKNAYIQTAMHGQPFYKSGKRAVRLLAANALSAIAVNSVGDFVLAMARLLILVCTGLIGYAMMMNSGITHYWFAIVISVIITAVVIDWFFVVFETAIDTIFLCFCEDSCMNDGISRPYYMTTDLMQYIEDAKATIKH